MGNLKENMTRMVILCVASLRCVLRRDELLATVM